MLVSQLGQGDRLTARIAGVPRLVNAATGQSKTARPFTFAASALATALAGALLGAALASLPSDDDPKTHSRVVMRTGRSLCGEILRVDKTTLVLKRQGSGTLRTLPLKETRSIQDDAC